MSLMLQKGGLFLSEEKEKTESIAPENTTDILTASETEKESETLNVKAKKAEDKRSEEKTEELDDSGDTVSSHSMTNSIFEWVQPLLVALVCVSMVLTFVFRQVTVNGTSMQNTLQDNDRLIITNMFYEPQVGDIVVISHGQRYSSPLIKRVIATEGQTLSINFDTGDVVVDGVLLDEPYTFGPTIPATRNPLEVPAVIPEGYVYVMGDHRNGSLDSRSADVGLINKNDIMGKAQFRIFPFSTFGSIY